MVGKRTLGIDYGTRMVGLACSDELGITVRPLQSVPNRGARTLLDAIAAVVDAERVDRIVVGMPLNMDGTPGAATSAVEKFVRQLARHLDMSVETTDERLSSIEAEQLWRGMPRRQQRRYRTVDSLAAAFILERYLRES